MAAASPAGTDLPAAGSIDITGVEASSQQAAYPVTNVIDGAISNAGRWVSATSDTQPTLTLTFGAPVLIRRIVVWSGYFSSGAVTLSAYDSGSALKSFRVEAELDGAWTRVAEVSGNDQIAIEVPIAALTTERLRLVITEPSSQDGIARVFEVYAYSNAAPAPLRHQPKPNLRYAPAALIENRDYRVSFYEATWDGGRAYVHDVAAKVQGSWVTITGPAERFDDQWAVFTGGRGSALDYYDTMDVSWVAFDSLRTIDAETVELGCTSVEAGQFSLTWNLREDRPRLSSRLTVEQDGDYVVGYQSFSGRPIDAVDEVLCGPLQHAKVVFDKESLATWMLTVPACLTQQAVAHRPFTLGIFMSADQIPFQNDHHSGATDQPYGMSLGDDDGLVRPLAFAPQLGARSRLAAGESHDVTFGLVAEPADLTTTYERLLRSEYDYRDYRENVYGQSMTDTMYNLIDLVMVDSGKDDSVDFQPSPSGWWNRAKGFVDIENPQTVRTTSAGVLLEAYLLTGDDDLYDKRAAPTIEFHVSRNGYGWTPKKGFPVYGDSTKYRLGSIPFDASTLSPLYNMTRGWNAGIKELAIRKAGVGDDYWLKRTPWSTSLALYRMTGDRAYLRDAETTARAYIATEIDKPYTTNLRAADFQYFYSKAWTELLELYEVTSNETYLDAAHKEARRYITQVFVRPVPNGSITVPRPPVINHVADEWQPSAIFAYPRTSVTTETTPDWVVSTNGATFEALTTYDNVGGGYTLNPAWAPFLLRLADHTGDKLLADVATNAIVGRYTNYPGYYNRQFMIAHIEPDFPLQGPSGASAIYYSHIPVQLGMTIDWLITEQLTRSRGAIDFPSEFEATYVWFKYRTYGHKPGRFYGDDDVWLWMPRGIATLDNPQVNWVSAEGNGRLYLSLTNASQTQQSVSVTLDGALTGIDPRREYRTWIIQDNGARRQAVLRNGRVQTSVSPKGITAIIVDGVKLNVPLHEARPASSGGKSFHFDDSSPIGIVRGMLLVKPDLSRYDAYIQSDTESPATLHYSIDGGTTYIAVTDNVYPNEWTIPVPDLAARFRYFVEAQVTDTIDIAAAEASSERAAYPASNVIDGAVSDASRWLSASSDTQPKLTLTFSAPTPVGRLAVVSGNFLSGGAYQPGSALNSFRVEAELDDGWIQVADITGNDQLEVQVPFDVVTTQRLRLVITKGSSLDTIARVSEVYAYPSESPATKRTDEAVLSLDSD